MLLLLPKLSGNDEGKNGSTGSMPVDLASARKAKADRLVADVPGISGFTHYAKISGWYIREIGCGGQINGTRSLN